MFTENDEKYESSDAIQIVTFVMQVTSLLLSGLLAHAPLSVIVKCFQFIWKSSLCLYNVNMSLDPTLYPLYQRNDFH